MRLGIFSFSSVITMSGPIIKSILKKKIRTFAAAAAVGK
jgi:hypothetical protein